MTPPVRAAPLSQQPPHHLAPLLLPFTLTSALRTHDIRTHDIVFVDYAHIITTQLIENTKKVGSGSKKSRGLGSVDDYAISRSSSKNPGGLSAFASTRYNVDRRNKLTMDGGSDRGLTKAATVNHVHRRNELRQGFAAQPPPRSSSKPPPRSMGLNGRPPSREV